MKTKKALIIVTSHTNFNNAKVDPTGLWLSELTHFYDVFEKENIPMDIVSISGGDIPIDSRSLGWMVLDKATKNRHQDPDFMALLKNTLSISEVNTENYDIIYFAGGHGAMWDFADNALLNSMTQTMFEDGKIVAAVCHGISALQNVKLSNGDYLIKGKRGTGFAFFDETVAGVKKLVPYNLEQRLKDRGMIYSKAFFPLGGHTVVDGNLITGQNPNSATETAKRALELLLKIK